MTEKENTPNEEKPHIRPGYSYATADQTSPDQFVRVKLEINGQVQIVPVCALCHKAFRLCSLDPNITEEQIASAKYLGLADGTGQDTSDHSDAKSDKKEGKDLDEKKDTKDSMANKSSIDGKDHPKDSAKAEDEKKKKKKSDESEHRRNKPLPNTQWTTNKPSHDEWDKKKKKDF